MRRNPPTRLVVLAAVAGAVLAAGPPADGPVFAEACEGLNRTLDICSGAIVPEVTDGPSGDEPFDGLELRLTVADDLADRHPTDHYRVSWRIDGCTHVVSYDLIAEEGGWVATLFETCGETVTPIDLPDGSAATSGGMLTWWIDATQRPGPPRRTAPA